MWQMKTDSSVMSFGVGFGIDVLMVLVPYGVYPLIYLGLGQCKNSTFDANI